MEHEGAYYKIINFYRQQNSVNQYIIQSLITGKSKIVLIHQISDAEITVAGMNYFLNKMFQVKQKYHTFRTIPKSNRKRVDRVNIDLY